MVKRWQTLLAYRQQDYRSWPSYVKGHNQIFTLPLPMQGFGIRIQFDNEFGIEPIYFKKLEITVEGKHPVTVTARGQEEVLIRPGERFWSDPCHIDWKPKSTLRVSTFLDGEHCLTSGTVTYSRSVLMIANEFEDGDHPQESLFRMVKENPRMQYGFGIRMLQVLVESGKQITVFGDSLTQQGFWIDGLKHRLATEGFERITIANQGIGGNQVTRSTNPLSDSYQRHGIAGTDRFEADVFGDDIPDLVVIYHGINDFLPNSQRDCEVTASEVIDGLKSYLAICSSYGVPTMGVTLTPMSRSIFYTPQLEANRQKVNEWIRKEAAFDGVLDFDQMMQSPEDPSRLGSAWDNGDGLHFNREGGDHLAASLPLEKIIAILEG